MSELFSDIKCKIVNNKKLLHLFSKVNRYFNPTNQWKVKGTENIVVADGAFFTQCRFQLQGHKNEIYIEPGVKLYKCSFVVTGDNNKIRLGRNGVFYETEFYVEDNANWIQVGCEARFCGKTQLATIESTKILIGKNCLFSSNIQFRTGDSHSVLDAKTGMRINPSKSIYIGSHVWIGSNVICLKGTYVANDSIIGAASLLTGSYDKPGSMIVGSPAAVKKQEVTWRYERIEGVK